MCCVFWIFLFKVLFLMNFSTSTEPRDEGRKDCRMNRFLCVQTTWMIPEVEGVEHQLLSHVSPPVSSVVWP